MEDLEPLRKTLEHYRQQRQQKSAEFQREMQRIDAMIAQLEADLGEQPSTDEAASVAASSPLFSPNETPTLFRGPSGPSIEPDEFFGLKQTDAARAYLRKIGKAVPFDELVEALGQGGAKLGGRAPKKTLYVSLARNPGKVFVWPRKGYISLAEFYGKKESGS